MTSYKHIQISYLILTITLAVFVFFMWSQIMARLEPVSVNSGTNFLITSLMVLVLFILISFSTLTVSINESNLKVKFGFGIFTKKFLLKDIASVKIVKNPWYCGWGIRLSLWPKMWIYNVSGFDAVEIVLKNKKIYRIGTDEPEKLEVAIKKPLDYN